MKVSVELWQGMHAAAEQKINDSLPSILHLLGFVYATKAALVFPIKPHPVKPSSTLHGSVWVYSTSENGGFYLAIIFLYFWEAKRDGRNTVLTIYFTCHWRSAE